ncbi:MAG: FimV/HubP family polar landmark protein [Gammaproteobacteria bacterium]
MKVRNLARGLPLLAVLTPGTTWCLGLGDITVSTALNQPLRADIRVLSAEPDDIENMRTTLASQQVFDGAGIQRPFALTQLRFNVVPATDGGAIIQVTTREPVREPFLNFLIEMRWPNGRLVREYTVLLDPPVLTDEQGIVISNAPVVPREAGRAQAAAGSASVTDNGRAASSPPSARANAVASQSAPAGNSPTSYTVVFGDTLYKIAQRYRPDGSIRLSRMMVAIYRANPEAFAQGNLNGLVAGMTLRMPDAQEIAAVDSEAAVAEVGRHNAAWSESSEPMPTESVVEEPSAQAGESIGEQPAADTMATEPKDSRAQANDNPGRLKIAAASESGAAAKGEDAIDTAEPRPRSDAENEQLLAREAAVSRQMEIDSMQTRVAELESMLAKQARVISLQSEALADLQARLGANGADVAQYDGGAPQAGVVAEADTQVQPDAAADDPEVSTGTASGGPDRAALDEPASPPAGSDTPNALLANPVMLVGAGAVGLLLLALIWLAVKRAASRTQTIDLTSYVDDDGDNQHQAAAITPGAGATEPAKTATVARAHAPTEAINEEPMRMPSANQGRVQVGEQAARTGNDDTLAEADVYIAYGMHQQGEDLLQEAIARDPERIDYRLKLLEIYYAGRNHGAFDDQAQALYDTTGGKYDAAWERVVAMGLELNPRNPMFAGSEADANAHSQAAVSGDQVTRTTSGMTTEATDAAAGLVAAQDPLLGARADRGASQPSESPANTYHSKILEFDLGDFDAEIAADASAASSDTFSSDRKDDLSFDLSELDGADESADSFSQTPTRQLSGTEDGDNPHASPPDAPASLIELDADSIDDTSFSIELTPSETEDARSTIHLSSGAFIERDLNPDNTEDLSDINEVGTKLDLARAFIDMGDADGALSTLEEVLQEGDDDQREQAETLMRQIA